MKSRGKLIGNIWNWKKNRLFVRMMWQLSLLVLVPLCGIMIISFFSYTNMWEQEMERQCGNMADQVAVKWKGVEAEIAQEFSFITFDEAVELFIYDDQLSQRYYDVNHISKLLLFPALTRDYVENVYVYSVGSGAIIDKERISKLEDYSGKNVLEEVLKRREDRHMFVSEIPIAKGVKSLACFWNIEKGRNKAVLAMRFSTDKLNSHVDVPEYGEYYIANEESILLSNKPEMIGKPLDQIPYYKDVLYGRIVKAGNQYIDARKIADSDVEIITILDSRLIGNDLGLMATTMVFFVVVMVMITVGLAIVISNKLYYPIREIVQYIKKDEDFPDNAEGFEGKDELEYILKSIEKRTYFAEDVDRELKQRLTLLKKAQAIALQSQINPHFINNTLETIDYMSIFSLGRDNQVSEIVHALSGMLKSSLDNTDALVTVREEVLYCEQYLKIQWIRYGDKFNVSWNVQPEILDYKMVRMILQPIVENAIYHGVKHLPGGGLLTISVQGSNGKIRIEVADNGLGMSKDALEKLNERLDQDVIQESKHIGISNVYQRLKLYYGEECDFFIESRLGVGTCVTIEIPCKG